MSSVRKTVAVTVGIGASICGAVYLYNKVKTYKQVRDYELTKERDYLAQTGYDVENLPNRVVHKFYVTEFFES